MAETTIEQLKDRVNAMMDSLDFLKEVDKQLGHVYDDLQELIKNSNNLREKKAFNNARLSVIDTMEEFGKVKDYVAKGVLREKVARHPRYRKEKRHQEKEKSDGVTVEDDSDGEEEDGEE